LREFSRSNREDCIIAQVLKPLQRFKGVRIEVTCLFFIVIIAHFEREGKGSRKKKRRWEWVIARGQWTDPVHLASNRLTASMCRPPSATSRSLGTLTEHMLSVMATSTGKRSNDPSVSYQATPLQATTDLCPIVCHRASFNSCCSACTCRRVSDMPARASMHTISS